MSYGYEAGIKLSKNIKFVKIGSKLTELRIIVGATRDIIMHLKRGTAFHGAVEKHRSVKNAGCSMRNDSFFHKSCTLIFSAIYDPIKLRLHRWIQNNG